jgi:hypothetical protein
VLGKHFFLTCGKTLIEKNCYQRNRTEIGQFPQKITIKVLTVFYVLKGVVF